MTPYELAFYFWSLVLVTAVAAPFAYAFVERLVHRAGEKRDDHDSEPSLPSIPSWPSSA